MAGSIKFFQFVQKCHEIVGMHPSQSNQNQWSNNLRTAIFIGFAVEGITITVGCILFEAESLFDYGFAFFILNCLVDNAINFLSLIWQAESTFKFIKHCEGFIEKRK